MKNKPEKHCWVILTRNRRKTIVVIGAEEQFGTAFDACNFADQYKLHPCQLIKIKI